MTRAILSLALLILASIACTNGAPQSATAAPQSATAAQRVKDDTQTQTVRLVNCANPEGLAVLDAPGGNPTGTVYQQGDEFDGSYVDADWIAVDGGFVSADYVCEAGLPQVTKVVCKSGGLNVRIGAGTEYLLVTDDPLPDGTLVTLTGNHETPVIYEWDEISSPVNGWVSSKYLCEEIK